MSLSENITLLAWQIEAGADEAIINMPQNYFELTNTKPTLATSTSPQKKNNEKSSIVATPLTTSPNSATLKATSLADAATNLKELEEAVSSFDGITLQQMAQHSVFSDGNAEAKIMIIGDTPNADDEQYQKPFSGRTGDLLTKMFEAIDISRDDLYLCNAIFWKTPGGREPSDTELMICRPFVEKHIALAKPDLLILMGGATTKSLLGNTTSITRLRKTEHNYTNKYLENHSIKTMAMLHPSQLIKHPAQKKLAWQDLQKIHTK